MRAKPVGTFLALIVVLASACTTETGSAPLSIVVGPTNRIAIDDALSWSEPVWLGPVVNSTSRDWRPVLSGDGKELYFHSDRPGMGGFDIYVSRRAGPNCPWQAPSNLGAPINTIVGDGDPAFTPGDRVMFFSSERSGGAGRGDIFVSQRAHPGGDLAWETPVNLGPLVNTTAHESNPWYVASEAGGTLYFERGPGGANAQISDIYKVEVSRDGDVLGPVVIVSELSATSGPHAVSLSADGRELIFWSGGAAGSRPGTVGLADLWVTTRRSVNNPWSAPQNVGIPVNTTVADLSGTLSHDGRTLLFTSVRAGGSGLQDLWMAERRHPGEADGPEKSCTQE